jgi:hypothetical protein
LQVAEVATKKKRLLSYGFKKGESGFPECGGGGPSAISTFEADSLLVRCESGDVGAMLSYPVKGGRFKVAYQWDPGLDVEAAEEDHKLCELAGIDCGDCPSECANVHATSHDPVLSTPGRAWLADRRTGKETHALQDSAGMTFTTAYDSTWIAGVKNDAIRIWDSRDGALVWSGARPGVVRGCAFIRPTGASKVRVTRPRPPRQSP